MSLDRNEWLTETCGPCGGTGRRARHQYDPASGLDADAHTYRDRASLPVPEAVPNPRPKGGDGSDIGQEVIELARAQRAKGLREYGQPLQAFNGRDVFMDLATEQLDATAYTLQLRREFRALQLEVIRAREVTAEAVGLVRLALRPTYGGDWDQLARELLARHPEYSLTTPVDG